jgi:hypothetical protein
MNDQGFVREVRDLFRRMKAETAAAARQLTDDQLLDPSQAVSLGLIRPVENLAIDVARQLDRSRAARQGRKAQS